MTKIVNFLYCTRPSRRKCYLLKSPSWDVAKHSPADTSVSPKTKTRKHSPADTSVSPNNPNSQYLQTIQACTEQSGSLSSSFKSKRKFKFLRYCLTVQITKCLHDPTECNVLFTKDSRASRRRKVKLHPPLHLGQV